MLQSTDCFHQCHIDCLREEAIKQKSENENVKCGRCLGVVADYEFNEYLSPDDKELIEKSQQMQIVKLNPNFVCCQCGNVMELLPGEVQKGLKDERGNLLTPEAAKHMA